MSAIDFQRVMAHFIRFPTAPYEKILSDLGPLDLTEKETSQLGKMAEDPLVRKFGEKMSFCRQRDATEVMKLSKAFFPAPLLRRLFVEHFEPLRKHTDFVMSGVQFLDFMLTDEKASKFLEELPPFVKDVMRYDYTKALVVRLAPEPSTAKLPRGSYLAHDAFRILDVAFDLPTIDQKKTVNPQDVTEPKPSKKKLLFIGNYQPPYYRMFQIDEAIEAFLFAQLKDPTWWQGDLPPAHKAMVRVGLCVDLPRAQSTLEAKATL